MHPANSYIIRGKSAGMECEAVGADKAYFVCNGEAMSSSASSKGNGVAVQHETARVDVGTGAETRALTLEVISVAVRYCEEFLCRIKNSIKTAHNNRKRRERERELLSDCVKIDV